jgi:hypothetical protein
MGILWARAGCAVLIMDQIGHGERLQNYPWNREAYHSRYVMGMQFYVAAKGAFSVPVLTNASNVNEAIIVPIGLQIPTSQRVRFYVEAGPIAGFAQQTNGGSSSSTNSFGGYGTVALTFLLR